MPGGSERCVRTSWTPQPRPSAPGCARLEPPAALLPRRRCACAQDAGCWVRVRVRGAARRPQGQGVTRGLGAARTRRPGHGAQVPRAGTCVPPHLPPRHLLGLSPAPAHSRAHSPARARAPGAPLTRARAQPPPRPRLGCRCRCGRSPGQQRFAPRTERPGHRATWPAAQSRTLRDPQGLWPCAPHAPHRRQRATRCAGLQPQL